MIGRLDGHREKVREVFEKLCWAVGARVHYKTGRWQLLPEIHVCSREEAGLVIGQEGVTSKALARMWRILCKIGEVPTNAIGQFYVAVVPEHKSSRLEPIGLEDLIRAILDTLAMGAVSPEISETEGSAAVTIKATPTTAHQRFPVMDVLQILRVWGQRNDKTVNLSVRGFANERPRGGNAAWERRMDD